MAIRAFLTTWSLVDGGIENPVIQHVDQQPNMGITLTMIYPDADGNGLPDKPIVLVLAESQQVPGAVLEQIGRVEGVTLIPGERPGKRMADLPPTARTDINGLVSKFNLPQSVVNGANTYGDFLGAIEKYIAPNSNGVASYVAKRPLEFG